MTDLVIATINGKTQLSKLYGSAATIEKPLGTRTHIKLSEIEADMTLGELAQALEFGMLDALMK